MQYIDYRKIYLHRLIILKSYNFLKILNTTTIVFQFLISFKGSVFYKEPFTVTLFFVAPYISDADILKVSTHQKQFTVYVFFVSLL